MNNKIETSIQFYLTNYVLVNEVFLNWKNFSSKLNLGPDKMRDYLYNEWYDTKAKSIESDDIIIKDFDRKVSREEFSIKFVPTKNGIPVFYLTFPSYHDSDSTGVFVALALCEKMPRYIAMVTSRNPKTEEFEYVVIEYMMDFKSRRISNNVFGSLNESSDLNKFISCIEYILQNER